VSKGAAGNGGDCGCQYIALNKEIILHMKLQLSIEVCSEVNPISLTSGGELSSAAEIIVVNTLKNNIDAMNMTSDLFMLRNSSRISGMSKIFDFLTFLSLFDDA